ncbi:hypothetical protein [Nocardioides sp. AE5]|uniref:hypothetical protein n=1 Tax=Nocardioides sp. AE5 TaxID=2962573 RepID=UPI0028814B9F|nr:hypothetical protein [Nocardioides sp. AE5]MDT0201837.1 hypothetical protein [Nocardioides sp. AE5]
MPACSRSLPAILSGLALAAGFLTGCTADEEANPQHVPTPLASYDAEGVLLQRAEFCPRVSDAAIEATVGEVASTEHHGNGDQVTLADGIKDVSHEFNCTWTGAEGVVASGWIYAPPVPPERAEALIADARGEDDGCGNVTGQGFGTPSTGTVCRTADATVVTYQGLFVDSWLACSLSVPDPEAATDEVIAAAGAWCVEVARAATAD